MELRYYQREAVDATYQFLRDTQDENPLIVLPTGAGKTPVIAQICKDAIGWGRRVLITSHRAELLEQNKKHALFHGELEGKVGLYSAGLRSRDTEHPILVAGVQSVWRRMDELGAFDVILVDEAHLVSEREESMYQRMLQFAKQVNPKVRIIGLTATPYRTGTGHLCGDDRTFQHVAYEESVRVLIEKGYLCHLRSKAGISTAHIETDSLHVRRGDYIESEMAEVAMQHGMVNRAVTDIIEKTKDRKKVLVFVVNIEHGQEVTSAFGRRLKGSGVCASEVYGDSIDRVEVIQRFKDDPSNKFLVNCNLLTIGFDYPAIDGVVLLRPTISPGLYYQMVGRGLRLEGSKDDCLVLDYGNNIKRHGPLDAINPEANGGTGQVAAATRQCPECGEVVMRNRTVCPDCGHVFQSEKIEVEHGTESADDDIMGERTVEERVRVMRVEYNPHTKYDKSTGAPLSRTMRVDYMYGVFNRISEWVCIEHEGYAGKKALLWWRDRTNGSFPCDVDDAVERAEIGELLEPKWLTIKKGGKWPEIVDYDFEEVAV